MDADKLRSTGRTTRMLQEAIRLSEQRHAVYVISASTYHREMLQIKLDSLNPPEYHGIKIEVADALPTFDWKRMCLKGAHPNCRVLVDHWVIESQYSEMLKMLHQFDAEE
jgi:hypothetical protein